MSDESNGRWVIDADRCCAIWEDQTGEPWSCSLGGADGPRVSAAMLALVALIEAAESTEPRNQPEPLPLMTGTEVMEAWDQGAPVERLTEGGWERWPGRDAYDAVRRIGFCTFAARVVEPPAPATERVPLAFVRGRRLPDGRRVDEARENVLVGEWWALPEGDGHWHKAVPITVDADGTVEVLTEGTDKP